MKKTRWWVPDVIDLHLYGGAFILSVGVALRDLWHPWAGLALFGAILFLLGLKRG